MHYSNGPAVWLSSNNLINRPHQKLLAGNTQSCEQVKGGKNPQFQFVQSYFLYVKEVSSDQYNPLKGIKKT